MKKVLFLLFSVLFWIQWVFAHSPEEKASELKPIIKLIIDQSKNKDSDAKKVKNILTSCLNSCNDNVVKGAIKIILDTYDKDFLWSGSIPEMKQKQVNEKTFINRHNTLLPQSYTLFDFLTDGDFLLIPKNKKIVFIRVYRDSYWPTPILFLGSNWWEKLTNTIKPYGVFYDEKGDWFYQFNKENKAVTSNDEWRAPWATGWVVWYVFEVSKDIDLSNLYLSNTYELKDAVKLTGLKETRQSSLLDFGNQHKDIILKCKDAMRFSVNRTVKFWSCMHADNWFFREWDPKIFFDYYNKANKYPYNLEIEDSNLWDMYCKKWYNQKECLWINDGIIESTTKYSW